MGKKSKKKQTIPYQNERRGAPLIDIYAAAEQAAEQLREKMRTQHRVASAWLASGEPLSPIGWEGAHAEAHRRHVLTYLTAVALPQSVAEIIRGCPPVPGIPVDHSGVDATVDALTMLIVSGDVAAAAIAQGGGIRYWVLA